MDLWAFGTQVLGLSTPEFWALDQDELNARIHFYQQAERRKDERIGALWAAYANSHRPKDYKGELTRPGDLFGYDSAPAEADYEMTEEETEKHLQRFVRQFNAQKKAAKPKTRKK